MDSQNCTVTHNNMIGTAAAAVITRCNRSKGLIFSTRGVLKYRIILYFIAYCLLPGIRELY